MKAKAIQHITPEQAADMLSVSEATIKRMCRDGDIPARKVRSQWRVQSDFVEYLPGPFWDVA